MLLFIRFVICIMSGVLQCNGENDGGRLRSWRRILVLAVVMCVSLSAMFFSAWQAEAAVADAITDLKVSGIGYDQITLGWTTPNNGGSAITEYEIQQNSNTWTTISGSDAGTVSHTVTGLTPGTSDTFKVRAVNTDGAAPESNTVTVIPNKFAHNIPDGLTLTNYDYFGASATLSSDGTTLAVGAWGDDIGGNNTGAVHLFTRNGGTWAHSVKIDDNFTEFTLDNGDHFGSATALSPNGTILAVGAKGHNAVHIFTKSGDTWTHSVKIDNDFAELTLDVDDWFGSSVALSSDGMLAVGAENDDTGGANTNRGAVYLFTKNGNTWTHSVKIDSDFAGLTLSNNNQFGSAIAFSSDGTTFVVGAQSNNTGGTSRGAVHIFTKSNDIWTHSVTIDNDFTGLALTDHDTFGSSVALSSNGTALAVGAELDDTGGEDRGAVHLFNKHGTQWIYHSKIAEGSHGLTLSNGDHFGTSTALSSDGTLVVGALGDDTGGTGTNASRGAAHLFNFTDTIPPYIVTQTFTNNTPANGKYPKTGDTLNFSFTFSETLQTTPTITIEGTPATFSESTGTYTATYQVTDATAEGPIVYNIGTLTDSVGQSFDPPETNSPFIVDRIAPTLAVITDGTSGGDSYIGTTPDTTPDFSFTSNEAGTIAYAGICTSSETTAVNGTNTVSFSTLASATYTNCAVTVTDEAGNISSSLAVPSFTIDASASPIAIAGPDAAYATGQTISATTSSVTDEDWEYQLIDGGTDCTGTTTGTFTAYTAGTALTYGTDASPAVTTDADDGKKVCFKLTDTKGTASDTTDDDIYYLASGILRLDNAAPTLTAITDGTSGGDTTIGGTLDITPDLSFTLSGLRLSETATLLWTGDCTAESNTITSQTDAATDETITVTLNDAEDGDFMEGTTVTGCQVQVRDQVGNVSASLTIPSFTIVSPAPVFTSTVNAVTYRKGVAIATLTLPGLRPDTGHGNITFDLSGLPTGTGLTFTAPTTATGTGSLTGNPNQADTDASPFTLTYTATDSAPSPIDPRVVTLTFSVTVTDFAVTVTDDADGNTPEREKELTVTVTDTSGVTNALWGMVDDIASCTVSSNAQLTTAYTPSTTGTTITITDPDANSKVACFRATYTSNDYYGWSGVISGIDRTNPVVSTVPLAGVLGDAYLSSAETSDTNAIVGTVSHGETDTPTIRYAVVSDGTTCNAGVTYTATLPIATDVPNSDGTYKICVSVTDAATNVGYGSSDPFVKDTTSPTVSSVPLAGVLGDAYLSSAEATNTNAIVGTPIVSDTSSYTIAYAVVSGSITCNASVTYSATAPDATDVSGLDGTYKVCVRATDAATNVGYGGSPTFTKDTTSPTVSSVPLTGVLGDTYLSSAEATNTDAIVSPPTVSDTSTYTIAYAVVSDGTTCNASVAYSATVPNATDVPNSDGAYKVCASVTDAATNVGYSESATFTKDTTSPTISSVPLTGVLGDAYLSSAETSDTNAIVGTVSHGETDTPTIRYAVVSDGTTCNAGVTYTATLPIATDVPNSDGTYKICVSVTDAAGNAGYGSSDPFVKDTTSPTVSSVPLAGVLGDAYLSSAETSDTNAIVGTVSHGETDTPTIRYAVVSDGTTCNAGVTYTATLPIATDVPNSDGTYKICVSVTDAATNVGYGSSDPFVKDTTSPTVSSVPLAGVLGDAYLSSAEATNTNAIVGTPIVSDTSSYTIAYAVVSGSITCNASVTYSATAPDATDVSGLDGTYKVCVRATDAATNVGYGGSPTFTKDTTSPTVSSVPLTGVLGDTYLSSAEATNTDAIVSPPTVSDTSTYTIAYAVVSDGTTCNASVAYSATVPNATDVPNSDGAYKVCASVTDAATNVGYSESATFTKDTTSPTISSVPLTGVLGDAYLSSAETSDTNAIVGTVSHGETDTPTIRYAVVSDGTTCNAGVTYTATLPIATDVPNSDGTYKICVSVTDAATNVGYGESQTFTKDTSAPTLTRTISFNGENSHDNKVYLNQGDTITITVTANEDTRAGDKTVSLIIGSNTRSVTLTRGGANNRVYTGVYTVVSGETTDNVEIETPNAANDIFNLAGNPATPFQTGDTLVDFITQTAVIVDTTSPTAPTIDLREADDTYGDINHDNAYEASTDFGTNDDNITSNTNPYYTFGAVENTNGVTLTLRYAGAACAEHTVSGGDYTPDVQCTATQADGERAVTATVTDRAGNVSPAATALTVTIDTVDPPAMDIDLKSESDLGVSDTDNYTSSHDLTFTITGNTNSESLHAVLQKGATSQHNHPSAHADLSAPTGELTRNTGGTGDGENPVFKVLTHDLAGNTSLTATADAETVYLDYVTAVPSFTFNSAYDSGAQDDDSITNSRQLGFSIGNIEVEAANRGNGAEVTVYDDSGAGSTIGTTTISLADEIGHENAPVTTMTHTTETQQTDFSDGKHGFFVCQTDDAGNTSCTMNALNWIVDITPPASPTAPNLKAEDDSYGTNANDARDGTDGDSVTNKQSDLTFASFASGQGTHEDGAHDHHQIRFYKWTDANSNSAVDDGELAELKAPANNVADSSNIAETAGYGMSASGTEKNLYSASETLGEGVHRFVAKQYDIAGNLSAVSDPLEMRVDVTAPNPVTVILALHPLSDTGTSQADKQTSNVSPVFRFISGSAQSDDVDYYEVWRARLTEGHTTPQGGETYAYPSSSDTAEQTSYEYSASDSSVERTTELGATYGDSAYQNGALIEISSMTVPHFNSYYAFKVYAVDLAGNYAAGTDSETIRILVPPPKPEKMDLQGADDTARAALPDGNSDNITSATSWTLSGLYKNNSDHERDPDSDGVDDADGGSAGGVAGVEILIRRLDENNQETDRRTVSVTTTQSDGAISKPSNLATGDYTFSTEFDVLSAFGASAPDGTYVITVKAANGAGEEGESSDPLTITLDRQAPVPDAYLVLRTQWFSDGIGGYRFHRFTVTDASNGEPNGMVIAYDGGNQSRTLLPGTPKTIGSDDWSIRSDYEGYEVVYVDAAGNATDREAFPGYLKAPLITSYEIDQAAHKYLVIAGAQNNRALEGFKQFTYNSNNCDPDGAGITKTPYTPASVLTLPSDNVCVEATDGYGNTASILVRALAQPLITNFALNEDGNDPDRSPTDFITNNTTLRLQGTILSGSTARLEIKESSQSWGDPSDPNDNFEGTELAIPAESINADTGAFEVTYEVPASYHGGTHTLEVRGYVETSGATEIGPITLRDIMYDAEAPAKPSQAPSLLADSDDTGILGDGITAKTENINFKVWGEKEAIMTLSTGEMITNPSLSGNFEAASQIGVSSLAEGTHTITVTATDKAGNTSPPSDPFILTIDPTAPEVTIVRLNDGDTTIDSDTRFVTIAYDETTVAFRVAAIAKSDCEAATWTTTGSAYTSPEQFNPNTAFSTVANGACFIARDAAHNIATKHSDDAIEGVGDARITGATKEGTTFYTKSGQRELTGVTASGAKVLIKITADEPITFTGTQLRDTGFADHSFDMDAAATTFAEVITIPSGADGQKLIAWIWTDKSDQTTATPAITLGTLIVDDTPPTVTAAAIRTSNSSGTTAKQNDTLFLDITVNEIVQSATVTLAGITATEADCAVPSAANTQFTCSVTLSNEASKGAVRAEWTLRDRAGNETTGTLTSEIIIDATAPAVTVTSSRGMLVSANDALTLNLSVTDTNGITAGTYAFSATGGTLATCEVTATAGQKSVSTSCTLTVTATGDGAPVILTIPRLTDTPGNEKPQHTRVIARVDTTAPTLSAITDQDSAKKKKFSFTVEVVHNQHTDNRNIPETLTPLLGGDCEDFKTNAKFTAQVPDATTQTYTATATASKGTYEACTITLQDEAGNKSATLTFTEFTVKGGVGGIGIGGISGALFGKIQSFFLGGNQQQTPPRTPAPSAKIVPVALPARIAATCVLGDIHEHVRAAQILLNQTSCPVASSGPGSPGRETTYFGPLTQRAIICFQRTQGLPEDGTLTPRFYTTLLSAVRAGAAAPPARQTPKTVPDHIAATCVLGDTHEHVKAAQILLNKTFCPVASSGPGSPGRETTYFGPLTQRAITCFQRTRGLSEDGNLTPRLYTTLRSTVYPAVARQQTPAPEQKTPIRAPQPAPVPVQPIAEILRVTVPDRIAGTYILGNTHEHVRAAQILLNQTSCPVASSGPGSPGRETTYFGPLTQRAIICFQRTQGLPEDGTLTPRFYTTLLSAVRAGAAAPPARQTPKTVPDHIAATCVLGDTHEHVKAAQILLNKTFCPVASSGPGSPGRETTYFGPLTQRAITCFQRTRGLSEDGNLTPRLYTTLRSTVYPAIARQQTPAPEQKTPIRAPQPAPVPVQPIAEILRVTVPDRIAGTYILGNTHEHVRAAQILLNKTFCPVASSGPGSPGRETAYFGSLTQRAITCFQRARGRSEDGTLTPRLYSVLRSAVYPAAAEQTPVNDDQQEDRQPEETPEGLPLRTAARSTG